MKRQPPVGNASLEDIAKYLHELHECGERQHEENLVRFDEAKIDRDHIGHGLNFDRRINVITLLTFAIMIAGMFAAAVRWTGSVDVRLDTLSTAGTHRDVRLDAIDGNIRSLQDLAIANHETLVGADRTARGRQ